MNPITREESLLDGQDLTPITRKEKFIKRIYDKTQEVPTPVTREEWFLKKAGEGTSPVTIEQLNVTENGTYSETGKAYSPVTVEVPLGTKSITTNGTFNASADDLAGYSSVNVNVPYDFDKKSITNQPVASFSDAMNAPLYDLDIDIDPIQDLHGYDNPWAGGAGKNLAELEQGTIDIWTGAEQPSTTRVRTNYISIQTAQNYITSSENNGWSIRNGIAFDENKNLIENNIYPDPQSNIFHVSDSRVKYVRFIYSNANGGEPCAPSDYWYQFEKGSTATTYAPYANICPISGWTAANVTACGETYNISFGAAGTVYGGTLDVTTGVLTVDRASVDMGSLSYTYYRYGNVDGGYTDGISTDVKKPEPLGATSAISSHLTAVRDVVFDDSSDGKFSINVNGRIKVHWDGVSTDAELQTALSGVQLVYELATPQTYQLTPEEIKTIFDQQNNIYADTGNVNNVTYLAVASE